MLVLRRCRRGRRPAEHGLRRFLLLRCGEQNLLQTVLLLLLLLWLHRENSVRFEKEDDAVNRFRFGVKADVNGVLEELLGQTFEEVLGHTFGPPGVVILD